jgi:hypothetical protein
LPQKLDDCVKKIRKKWKADPGSRPKIREGQTEEGTAIAICRTSLKLEEQQAIELEGGLGPVLIDAAVTAKPHLRQRGREVKIVERDGAEYVEVPLFRQGIYRHPRGRLVFNDTFFDAMIKNHEDAVTDYNVHLDFRHSDKMGALAFMDKQDGGWLEKQDGWLVGYGVPVGEKEKELIKSRKWRYASAHFYKDYKSNLVHKLSSDDLDEMTQEELLEEVTMPRKFEFGEIVINVSEDDGVFALGDESVEALGTLGKAFRALADKVKEQSAEAEAYQARVAELEAQSDDDDGDEFELPESVKVQLEESARISEALKLELARTRADRHREKVAFILKNAGDYRDDNGNGHDKHFIDLAKAGLMLQEFEDGDKPVKLEDGNDTAAVKVYYQNLIRVMLETNPGTVPMAGRTGGDETRLENPDNEDLHYTDDELDEAIEEFGTITA